MEIQEIKPRVEEFLESKSYSDLRSLLEMYEPADIAQLLGDMTPSELTLLFRLLPKELAAETFVEMDGDEQELLIEAFSDTELKAVIDELYVDDAVDIIEEMPANVVKRILKHTDAETRRSINDILRYPSDSAGSIMTTEYVSLRAHMTVNDAFTRIRRTGVDKETIYTCYVTDENKKLIGLLSVRDLLLSDTQAVIGDIMETNIVYVNTHDDREDAARMFDKYDFIALPVVDNEKRLVGIVTFDDAIDVLREENTEDFSKMAAVSPTQDTYLKTPAWKHAKSRVLWLLFLMLSATVTGSIISEYENAFVSVPILVAFIPMLTGTGGNCGSQSSTMIIRGMTVEEIRPRDYFKVLRKEVLIALMVGVVLAVVNGTRIFIMYPGESPAMLALITGISLVGIVVLAKALGCTLPILAKICRIDPAIMASPVLSTVLDTCSVLIFFNVAMWIMSWQW